MREDLLAELRRTAREQLSWAELRPGQAEGMAAVLEGRDALVVMPTGAGKSAVYQVPALLLDGPTVVVSPLIALQRDQVAALRRKLGHRRAAAANSSLSAQERDEVFEALAAGDVEFLFLSPEQLARDEVVQAVAAARPSLLVVDEAHCISSWGHDFRPDYLRLGSAVERLGRPPVLALTATASPPVRDEVVERLGLREPVLVVRGFDRPQLRFEVQAFRDEQQQRDAVVLRAMAEAKPGIVYSATRRGAEELAQALADLGMAAAAYHAGMRAADRERVQAAFMGGDLDVVAATTAFGMGIDKADVRFVLHAEVPDSLDSYYQEVGRAGRDGQPAEAVLFYRPGDLGLRQFFAAGKADMTALRKVMTLLRHAHGSVTPADLAAELDVSTTRVVGLVDLLSRAGAVVVDGQGSVALAPDAPESREAARLAGAEADSHRLVERSRVDMVRGYAETSGCRRQYLLAYFGEHLEDVCGNCDTCDAGTATEQPDADDSPYPLQSKVRHAEWGQGLVMRYEGDRIVVLFEDVGWKTLSLEAVAARGLLEAG